MPVPCELSVVLPAYREADSLRIVLPKLVPVVAAASAGSEIIVSDAMEPLDDTEEVCAENGVVHIRRSGGNTYGDAVRSGIQRSRGGFVLLMDADGSHNPQVVTDLWRNRHKAEIVIGSRYVKGGGTENPALLILMSRVLNYAYQLAFRLPASDVSNSLRLYRGDQLRSLHLVSNNFDIVEEILIRLVAGRTHSTVLEVPMTFEQRKAGESKRNLPAFMLSYLSSMRKMQRFRSEELAKDKRERSE
ncbi:MAG: glycosyltransferase [Candidatus Sulfotelmatobacter sp.]